MLLLLLFTNNTLLLFFFPRKNKTEYIRMEKCHHSIRFWEIVECCHDESRSNNENVGWENVEN